MSIYRRGNTLWIKLRDARGRLLRRSAHTSDRAQALALESQLKREFGKRHQVSDISAPCKIFFSDYGKECMDSWRATLEPTTTKSYTSILAKLEAEFGRFRLDEITVQMITSYRNKLSADHAPGTVNRYLSLLSGIFTIAKENDQILKSPVKWKLHSMKEPPPRNVILAPALIDRFLGFFQGLQALHVLMRILTGMRTAELDRLLIRDIDFDQSLIAVSKTKNNQPRNIPVPPSAKEALRSAVDHRNSSERLFSDCPSYRKRWARAVRELGLESLRPHDLRHSFATFFRRAGGDVMELQTMLGHKSLEMTRRYSKVDDSDRQIQVRKMDGYLRERCALNEAQLKKGAVQMGLKKTRKSIQLQRKL